MTTVQRKKKHANHPNNDVKKELQNLSHFMRIDPSRLRWQKWDQDSNTPNICFNFLAENLQDSAQYVLFVGIVFKEAVYGGAQVIPVIKKDGDYCKSIGVCKAIWSADCFNKVKTEGTYKIH